MTTEFLQRWRWAILIAALLVGGLIFALWPEAARVDLGKVTRGPMEVGVTDDGVSRVEEYYVVSAPVTGKISRIELEPGDKVANGDVITTMRGRASTPLDVRSRRELVAALAAARAAAQAARSSLGQARRDLARAEQLMERGFLSKARLETEQTRVATEAAGVRRANAEVARISAQLADSSGQAAGAAIPVRAPASGSVMSVINESEAEIAQGMQLMTIGDPGKIEVVVDLLSREAVRVQQGDKVRITEWGGADPLIGYVKRVEPFGKLKVSALGIEEQRVNVIIGFADAAAKQAARLGHGYQIDATIILWSKKDALRVPIGGLFRSDEGAWQVFEADGSRARVRDVKLGQVNDEYGEVLEGLSEGAMVVLNPAKSLEDGSRISER